MHTDSFYSLDDIAIFRPKEALTINEHEDIKGKTVGVVRGYGLKGFDDMFETKKATRFDAKDEKPLLNMLHNGRLDTVFINKDVFLYHQMHQPIYQQLIQGDIIGSYQIGIRVHPAFKHIIPALNQAIKNLNRNKRIQEISESFNSSK
jgi:ABC-type amino acid transport substrate-binding protein